MITSGQLRSVRKVKNSDLPVVLRAYIWERRVDFSNSIANYPAWFKHSLVLNQGQCVYIIGPTVSNTSPAGFGAGLQTFDVFVDHFVYAITELALLSFTQEIV